MPPPLPSLESVLRVRVSTLRHVPKVARDAWAGVVGEVTQSISFDPTLVDSWVKFFMLAKCILTNPVREGRSHWRNTQRLVQARIAQWRAEKVTELWNDVLETSNRLSQRLSRNRPNTSPAPELLPLANARRTRRAAEDGQYRKAIQLLSSAGIAQSSRDVLEAMLSKHPQSAPSSIPSPPPPPPVHVSESDVVRALQSFPSGTAPGPSSLRANHLKEAVFCPSPDHSRFALNGLQGVINLLCAGRIPNCIVPHMWGLSPSMPEERGWFPPDCHWGGSPSSHFQVHLPSSSS